MKTILGALVLCSCAFAGTANAQMTWYLGADVVRVETKVTDKTGTLPDVSGTAKANSLRLKGGAHLLPWLDLELQVVVGRDETYSTAGATNKIETGVAGIFAKPHHQIGPVDLYALVGFSSSSHEFTGLISGDRQTVSDISYGVGTQYKVSPKLAISVDWTQYTKKDIGILTGGSIGVEVKAVGIGFNYTF